MLTSYPQLPSLHNWEIIFPSQTKPCFQIPLQQHKTISYSYCCSQNNSCPCVVWSLIHVDSPLPGICTQPFSASCIDHSSATAPPLPGLWLLWQSSFSGSLPRGHILLRTISGSRFGCGSHRTLDGDGGLC